MTDKDFEAIEQDPELCKHLDAFADALADAFLQNLTGKGASGEEDAHDDGAAPAAAEGAGAPGDAKEDDGDDFYTAEDEALAEAQDAVMAGDYARAEAECRAVLARKKDESDAYVLLHLCAQEKRDVCAALAVAREWTAACGASTASATALAEAAFLLGEEAVLREAAALLQGLRPGPRCPGARLLRARVAAASLLSEFPDTADVREALMAACVGLEVGDDFGPLVDVLAAYTDRHRDAAGARRFFEEQAAAAATAPPHTFERDVALLARALYALWTLDTDGAAACRARLAAWDVPPTPTAEDPNMAAVLALVEDEDGDRRTQNVHTALTGCNIIFMSRLASVPMPL